MINYMADYTARLYEVKGLHPLTPLGIFRLNEITINKFIDTAISEDVHNRNREKVWGDLMDVLVIGHLGLEKNDINIESIIQNMVNSNLENYFLKNTERFNTKVGKATDFLVSCANVAHNYQC